MQKYLPKTCSQPKRKPSFSDSNLNIKKAKTQCQDHSINNLVSKLSLENVVDLVLQSMHSLPNEIPSSFVTSFIPITDAGSSKQIEHLAHLLNTQIKSTPVHSNKTYPKKAKSSKLLTTIKPFDDNEIQRMSTNSFHRILQCECLYILKKKSI